MNGISQSELRPLSGSAGTTRDEALRHVTDAVHRVNEAIVHAVNAGVSVELVRHSRCHDGCGNWGDQMTMTIRPVHPCNVK